MPTPVALAHEDEADVNGVHILVAEVENADADTLLDVSDREKQRRSPAAVVLGALDDGRVRLVANFDAEVAEQGANASEIVKAAAGIVGGGGGRRPTMARAGGRDPEKLRDALEAAKQALLGPSASASAGGASGHGRGAPRLPSRRGAAPAGVEHEARRAS